MEPKHLDGVVALQRTSFPPPFPEELHWQREHLARHLEIFPQGQFVGLDGEKVIASASNTLISEECWQAHESWEDTVGGPFLNNFDPNGSTLYGLDISVHPDYRSQGVGRRLYEERFKLARTKTRYGTACRLPGYRAYAQENVGTTVEQYADYVVKGLTKDRTLTPLLRYGLTFRTVIRDYMEDYESDNAAALLEWLP